MMRRVSSAITRGLPFSVSSPLSARVRISGCERGLHASRAGSQADPPPPGARSADGGGLFGRLLQKEMDSAASGDAELSRAFAAASAGRPAAAAAGGAAAAGAGGSSRAAGEGGTAEGGSSADTAPPPPPRGRMARFADDVRDVLCVTFGMERRRDVVAEYASGERAYPWVTYMDPASGRRLFLNRDSGVLTEIEPPGWERFASAASELTPDTDASALTTVAAPISAWERTLSAVSRAPLVAALVEAAGVAGEAAIASPVGQAAKSVRTAVEDKVEEAREVWETSQHP